MSLAGSASNSSLSPDPLDVAFYGLEDAPRETRNTVPRLTGHEFLWRVLRKELIGVDLSNRKLERAEIVRYQSLIRSRLEELGNASNQASDGPSEAADHAQLIELANKAYAELEHLKHSLAANPTVNPSKVYRENLAARNNDSQHRIRLYRCSETATTLHLEAFDLRTCPKFAALSYTWGRDAATAQIGRLPVTTDLKAAVIALAASGQYEWLWLDAICINQSHPEEKSDQVSKMRQVYEKADAVFVWLGRHDSPCTNLTSDDIFVGTFFRNIDQGVNAWWSRLWVIQELVSARRVWVCTGNHVCSWDHFLDLVCRLPVENGTARVPVSQTTSQEQVTEAQTRLRQLHELRRLLRSCPGGEQLLDLLRLTNLYHCSNPRDHIYGLLGLATARDQRGIKVDYSNTTAAVFGSVVLHLADSKGRLDVMVDQWQRHTVPLGEHSLPSWVPDFSLPIRREHTALVNLHAYNASASRVPSLRISPKRPQELKVLGFRVGVIDDALEQLMDDLEDEAALDTFRLVTLPTWQNFTEPALRRRLPANDPYGTIARNSAPWRSLVVDHGRDRVTPAPAEFGDIIDILKATAHEESAVAKSRLQHYGFKPLDMIEQVRQTQRHRSLLTTSNGFVGIGPLGLRKGDEVIIALGASVPFVIRETSVRGKFTLVGEAYVHGIMYGEAAKLVDSGRIRTAPITLV